MYTKVNDDNLITSCELTKRKIKKADRIFGYAPISNIRLRVKNSLDQIITSLRNIKLRPDIIVKIISK